MYFGLDIFPEAVVEVYVVRKQDDIGTRIGDDINRKRNPETAPGKNAWTPIRATAKSTKDGVGKKLLYTQRDRSRFDGI